MMKCRPVRGGKAAIHEPKRIFHCASRAALLAGLLTVATSAAFAQGAARQSAEAWKATVAAAQKEGKVLLYTAGTPPVVNRAKSDFEKAYPGITFEWLRSTSGPLMAKIDLERQTNADGADVVLFTEVLWFEARAREGLLKPPVGPSMADWPASALLGGAIAVAAMEPFVMMYNTNVAKSPLTGYRDLLRPEFKGRIGVLDLRAGTAMIAFYDWVEKNQGADHLTLLAAQQPRIYTGAVPGSQSVASGEYAAVNSVILATALASVALGAPVKIVFPSPGFAVRYAAAAVGWSKRPNAALVLMDYLMSVRGQTAWNGGGESASVLPNIPGALDSRALAAADLAPYTAEVIKARQEKWDGVFKK